MDSQTSKTSTGGDGAGEWQHLEEKDNFFGNFAAGSNIIQSAAERTVIRPQWGELTLFMAIHAQYLRMLELSASEDTLFFLQGFDNSRCCSTIILSNDGLTALHNPVSKMWSSVACLHKMEPNTGVHSWEVAIDCCELGARHSKLPRKMHERDTGRVMNGSMMMQRRE